MTLALTGVLLAPATEGRCSCRDTHGVTVGLSASLLSEPSAAPSTQGAVRARVRTSWERAARTGGFS